MIVKLLWPTCNVTIGPDGPVGSLPAGVTWHREDRVVILDANTNGHLRCAVTRRHSSAGANPARQLSLQPVAVGADDGGNDIG